MRISSDYKLAVQTAGFGQNADYTWCAIAPGEEKDAEKLGRIIDGNTLGVMVQKNGDHFAVLLCGIKSTRYDYRDRTITAKFYVGDLTETKSRGIVITFLADEDNLSARLLKTIAEDVSEQGWNVDFEQIIAVIELIPEAPPASPFSDRLSNTYEESTKSVLIEELQRCAFSSGEGYKLYWGGSPNIPEYKEQLLREVDRFYSPTAKDAILVNLAPPVKPPVQGEPKPKVNIPTEKDIRGGVPRSGKRDIEAIRRANRTSQTPNEGFRGVIKDGLKVFVDLEKSPILQKMGLVSAPDKDNLPSQEDKKESNFRDYPARTGGNLDKNG